MATTYTISIAGISKELMPGWVIKETANGRATLRCAVLSKNRSYRPALGAEIIITEIVNGVSTRIFGGNIDTPSESGLGGSGTIAAIETRISAVDFNAIADRRHVLSGGFPAGTTLISALTDILGYLPGCTLDAAQDTGPALPLLQYDVRSITSILDELSVVTNRLWRIDYDKKLRMWTAGTLTAPITITTASRYLEGDVTVEPSRKDYANRIIIQAGTGTSEVTDSYISGGGTVLPLTYKLSTHRGYVTNQGVNEPIGVTTPPYWTYQSNTYPVLDTITRSSAHVAGNAIDIVYIAQFPYVTQSNDTGEQAANGIWEKIIVYPDVFDSTLAQNLASGQLLRSLVTSKTVQYITRQLGLHPGQTQTITASERNLSGTFLLTDVQITERGNRVWRTVTAVGGTQYPGSWRDAFKSSFGTSSGTTVGGTILITDGGGGGSSGTGTVGKLAKWTATDTLGDSVFTESGGAFTSGATGAGFTIALSASTVTGTLADARLTSNVPLKDNTLNIFTGSMTVEDTFTTSLIVSPGGASGTFWPGLMGLNAGAGTATPINLPIEPTGDLILNPGGKDILPHLGYDINIGRLDKKFLTLHAAELWVETLVAADVMATIGGRVVVAPTTSLTTSVVTTDTAINTKHNQMGIGDILRLETGGKIEFMAVTADAVANPPNGFLYTVTRNLDGTGANDFAAGDAVLNMGVAGDGFIDLYSMRGMRSGTEVGPTIVGNVRLSTTFNDWAPRWAIGHLNGLYGYSTKVYGAAFGDAGAINVTIDATNGFRIRHGTTNKLHADNAGNLFLEGDLSMGTSGVIRTLTATDYLTGTGYWLDYNAGTPRFRVGVPTGNRLTWDGTDMTVVSATVSIDSTGIAVAIPPPTYTVEYGYRFNTTFANSNFWGMYANEESSNERWLALYHTTTAPGKTLGTIMSLINNSQSCSVELLGTETETLLSLRADNTVVTGNLITNSLIKFGAQATASGAANLSTNCPAVTPGAPYTWLQVLTPDSSVAYVPVWK